MAKALSSQGCSTTGSLVSLLHRLFRHFVALVWTWFLPLEHSALLQKTRSRLGTHFSAELNDRLRLRCYRILTLRWYELTCSWLSICSVPVAETPRTCISRLPHEPLSPSAFTVRARIRSLNTYKHTIGYGKPRVKDISSFPLLTLSRLRIWMTCRIGDKLVNSILGRPATTAGISEATGPLLRQIDTGQAHSVRCMLASYSIISIIDTINTRLYTEQDVRPAVIEQLLESIDRWKQDFSGSLQQSSQPEGFSPSTTSAEARYGSIGKVHVSCLYYFAIVLATRPMFLAALTNPRVGESDCSPMGAACLQAAVYMAQACAEALDSGLLEANMCIMKALVFAAGLVLGFESFAKSTPDHEVEHALEAAKRILAFLALRSPQASHYLDILNSLSTAIAKRRQSLEPKRGNRYVTKLFASPNLPQASIAKDPPNSNSTTQTVMLDDPMTAAFGTSSFQQMPSANNQFDADLFIDWETINISQWDNFPFST